MQRPLAFRTPQKMLLSTDVRASLRLGIADDLNVNARIVHRREALRPQLRQAAVTFPLGRRPDRHVLLPNIQRQPCFYDFRSGEVFLRTNDLIECSPQTPARGLPRFQGSG